MGGSHDGALVVTVREPAERGRATKAALDAVAVALGVPRRSVTLASGPASRRKLVEVDDAHDPAVRVRLDELMSR